MTQRALISYRHQGAEYCFEIPADDWQDAERRLQSIASTGRVDGWPCYQANTVTFPLVALFARIRSWFAKEPTP